MLAFNNYENIGSANNHHHHHGVEDMIEENEPIFPGSIFLGIGRSAPDCLGLRNYIRIDLFTLGKTRKRENRDL